MGPQLSSVCSVSCLLAELGGLLNLIMGFSDWDTCPWPLFSDALMSVKTWGNRGGMQNSELAHTGQLFPFVCD